ncbi:MAG: hypothetical protein IH598_11850 [Bacteroidales bacterium]|nr:hypothetical protein [Bacteroidales bacterium]
MKDILFITLSIFLLISGCEDDPKIESSKIKGFKIYNENNELVTEYNYGYDSEGRLNYKLTPVTIENIQYINQIISVWNIKYDSGEKIETYYYNQGKLDSILNTYVAPRIGPDLITFYYENDKCIRKIEILNDEIINVYTFIYEDESISQIVLEQKIQNDTLNYVYEYDESGKVNKIFLNGLIYSEFEYTTIENPLFKVSKSYLIHIPVHPNQEEKETITSKDLLSKAKYYDWEGIIVQEISVQYNINNLGLPISAERTLNGKKERILFEYQ